MLNIENYDQWAKVCDDDDLIMELYNSGVRPGTDEFIKLLGVPGNGTSVSFKDYAVFIGVLGIGFVAVYGSVVFVNFVYGKTKQYLSRKSFGKKGGES